MSALFTDEKQSQPPLFTKGYALNMEVSLIFMTYWRRLTMSTLFTDEKQSQPPLFTKGYALD